MRSFAQLGVRFPSLLVPRSRHSLEKWCVIACDQYTSDLDYWQAADAAVGSSPSALRLVLPEVYLKSADLENRLSSCAEAMHRYLNDGVLEALPEGFMLVQRRFASGQVRTGLVVALDLERYSYDHADKTLIRSTEDTIPDRIPPRLKIRAHAPLELPHIMVLIDDPNHTVIDPLVSADLATVYDSDLAFNMGHITGRFVPPEQAGGVLCALNALYDAMPAPEGGDPMLFAMGDGNHSFATARAHWHNVRSTLTEAERLDHPARFALCELVNIHDPGLAFEAIHRVVFNSGGTEAVSRALERLGIPAVFHDETAPGQQIRLICAGRETLLTLPKPPCAVDAGSVDVIIAEMIKADAQATVDYIHGEAEVRRYGAQAGNIGFLLQGVTKSALFPTVGAFGPLPRKAFSMGSADEKRCYLEARAIDRI
ncbi:MAG: DUF1015 domain-containing protein [Clostridia bacterium]|nr:DUF1015 domain-containing protein [Clostridia bacterium]